MRLISDSDKYYITTCGAVISVLSGKEIVLATNRKGYYVARLSDNNVKFSRTVHRLVAQTYIPNPFNKPFVNHIDGNKKNNCVDNLEWCTAKENTRHAIESGLHDMNAVKVNMYNYSTGEFIKQFNSMSDASRELNVSTSRIWEYLTKYIQKYGKNPAKHVKGFTFKII